MSARGAGTRRRAREAAFRVAYQADANGEAVLATWRAREAEEALSADGHALVDDVVRTLSRDLADVDARLREAAEHWPVERLAATDRAVLRVAVAELVARPGTPARVVLDEAVEIARTFGTEESGRFVNGVLDRVARALRPEEFA
uniref:Transcription antitermination protein NusB n=1 Tax=Eiseniibacteriota bacterium TaxID=2212470 RepID=A0A832MLW0_UNCEI